MLCGLVFLLKDRIRNTIIWQRTRVTDTVQYVTNTKWKWAGHIARMKDNIRTSRSTEWQIKGVRSVGRPKCRWRDDIVGQQGAVWTRIAKDREIVCLSVGCLTSQQQASVSQGRICSDNLTCCHIEIEAADPTFYLTQSQYTDTGPTSPSADPRTPGAWQGSHWSAHF